MNSNDDLREFEALGLDREIKAPSHMKQRWHDSIDLAAQRELREQRQSRSSFSFMSFLFGAAITAALTVGSLQSGVEGIHGLRKVTVATVPGTTSHEWLERNLVRTRGFSHVREAVESVAAKEYGAAVYDTPMLRYLATHEFEGRIRVTPTREFDPQMYAFGLPPGSELRERINRSLLRQLSGQAWADLVRRHLGHP